MAHSYVGAFDGEKDAFLAYSETFPEQCIFLIDTYDTLEGAKNAVAVANEMKKKGHTLIGVRLDSGDTVSLSQGVRRILDDAGFYDVKIFASSGFDEFKIAKVLSDGARIDAFGVGTKVGVSSDAPFVDVVYKMVHFKDREVRKLSPGKVTLAGEKQVFRNKKTNGYFVEDIIGVRDESILGSEPLLEKVMENGIVLRAHPSLEEIRKRFALNFSSLDEKYKSISDVVVYPVKLSHGLEKLQ